jgi:hypothetical protein
LEERCSKKYVDSYLVLCLRFRRGRTSRAAREREAQAYWDSLSLEQEAWALRKMNFSNFGSEHQTEAGT